jgi:hypothetical protein
MAAIKEVPNFYRRENGRLLAEKLAIASTGKIRANISEKITEKL